MICKNCSAEYDDRYLFCPSCGQQKGTDAEADFSENDVSVEDISFTEEYSAPVYDLEEEAEELSEAPELTKGEEEVKLTEKKKTEEKKNMAKPAKGTVSKADKRAPMLVIIIMCIVAVTGAVLAVLNIKTGALEAKPQPQKAVALTKLSVEEEAVLEAELAEYFTVFRQNFDSAASDAESFLARINPADSGNIFSRLCASPLTPETAADPAMRFSDEYGNYTYYKVAAAEIDNILARFNLTSYGDINSKDCYYYDGSYYINYVPTKTTPAVKTEIIKSKKVLDGSFYVECYFYAENAGQIVKSSNCYLIVEKNAEAALDGYSFRVLKSDIRPLFTDSGNPTEINKSSFYTVESKVIEGCTDDGTLYSRYVIEYPVFNEQSAGIDTINQFYSSLISSYEQKAASAQTDYESFISQGGNVKELPFTETVITRVTYTDDSRISCMEKIATYSPEIPVKEEETTQEDEYDYYDERNYRDEFSVLSAEAEPEPVKLFTRTVEAYTFDKTTGDFISKDAVLGKDYMVISEILYRIYNAYDYTAVIPETPVEESSTVASTDAFGNPVGSEDEYGYEDDDYYGYDEYDDYYGYDEDDGYGDGVPADEEGFGTVIYESACAFTEYGFTFWYVESEGFVTSVTIPFAVTEKLAK